MCEFSKSAVREKRRHALDGLEKNCWQVMGFDKPVLCEGGNYHGIWLECAPQESLIYGRHVDPRIALNTHEAFFHHQRADGYIPSHIADRIGTSQIQMVVPIAATAWETFELTRDGQFLKMAYDACSRWDEWLIRYRNTRKTGLCEAFCLWDTGYDNGARFDGLPIQCKNNDASLCPDDPRLPYLAPDLSACLYGGRVALAKMAATLGRKDDEARWLESADSVRHAILRHCYDAGDAFFYDVDASGSWIRVKTELITRVFGEHVVEQAMFDAIYERHIKNPDEFWTPYPIPSVAINDPAFNREMPLNCWAGPSQALTALRAVRWFEHYGRSDDFGHFMRQWVKGILAADDFMQQMNPWTGEFSTSPGYSPAMLVFVEFSSRLGLC